MLAGLKRIRQRPAHCSSLQAVMSFDGNLVQQSVVWEAVVQSKELEKKFILNACPDSFAETTLVYRSDWSTE